MWVGKRDTSAVDFCRLSRVIDITVALMRQRRLFMRVKNIAPRSRGQQSWQSDNIARLSVVEAVGIDSGRFLVSLGSVDVDDRALSITLGDHTDAVGVSLRTLERETPVVAFHRESHLSE